MIFKLNKLLLQTFIIFSISQALYARNSIDDEILKEIEENVSPTLSIEESWTLLSSKKYVDIKSAIFVIVKQNPPQAYPALSALLEGQLYFNKQSNKLFVMREANESYEFKSLFTDESISQDNRSGYKKVKTNNNIRSIVRQSIATIQLQSNNTSIRLSAVEALLKKPDTNSASLVQQLIVNETDKQVLSAMRTLLAIQNIKSGDEDKILTSIDILSNSLNPSSLNALMAYEPTDRKLKQKKLSAVKKDK